MTTLSPNPVLASVAILAGGMGTRLQERSGALPKPMVPVQGRPLLEHQIALCREHGLLEIALLVHHKHEVIEAHFGDGAAFGVRLRYAIEATPRGTAGALFDALPQMADRFLILYGDTYADVDLGRLMAQHVERGADMTLVLHPNDHPHDSDLVEVDFNGWVKAIHGYPHAPDMHLRNLVNAAMYVAEKHGLSRHIAAQGKSDLAKQTFPAMLANGAKLFGYITPEYIKDMGTPGRLDKVDRDIGAGLPERLSTRQLRGAVLLDRDGTLNEEVGHLKRPEQVRLLPGVGDAVKQLNRAGVLAVVVTNQPVLARGDIDLATLDKVHAELESQLSESGAFVDAIYFCPHHPDRGFSGEVPSLKVRCTCRKPEPGMLLRACSELSIGHDSAWLVGDSTTDIEAGRRAGVRTVLVRTGHQGRDGKFPVRPDYAVPDLPSAINWILHGHANAVRAMLPAAALATRQYRAVFIGGLARAGKSCAAQILKELTTLAGRRAHVICLDGWLRPVNERTETLGVLTRYDVDAMVQAIASFIAAPGRVQAETRVYDRITRAMYALPLRHSLGEDDLLIFEGVPALLLPPSLLGRDDVLKLHVEVDEDRRNDRMRRDHAIRGTAPDDVERLIALRSADESPPVLAARSLADIIIHAL